MATGTLLGALRGYFGAMSGVQGVRSVFDRLGKPVPSQIAAALSRVVEAGGRDAANIVSQLTALRSSLASGPEAEFVDAAVLLVRDVYDETVLWPGGPTSMGIAKTSLGQAVQAAFAFGPSLKKALAVIIGIGAGIGASMVLYRVWQATDPVTSVARFFEAQQIIDQHAQSVIEGCAGNPECIKAAREEHARYAYAFGKDLLPDQGECGLIDTPTGTLIGGLVGLGFGWSMMRRLMRY